MSKQSYSMQYAHLFVEAAKIIRDMYGQSIEHGHKDEEMYQRYKELSDRFNETLKMQEQEHARDNWYKDLLKNPPFGTQYIY